jgi:hypothetical protein
MKPKGKTEPTPAAKKAGTSASASFKREAKQEEVDVENEKGSPLKKGAARVNERSRSSDGAERWRQAKQQDVSKSP